MALRDAILLTLGHNLDLQISRLGPDVATQERIVQEAVFDWNVYGQATWRDVNRPQPASTVSGIATGSDEDDENNLLVEAGIRKRIQYGGVLSFSTNFNYLNDQSNRQAFTPDPSFVSYLGAALTQPLLRDAGVDVNRTNITLAENAEAREVHALRAQLITVLGQTESAYWELVYARYRLAILEQQYALTEATRNELLERQQVDVTPVQMAQTERDLQARRGDVERARANVRNASDQLKLLLNAPALPLIGETVIHPVDFPAEVPEHHTLRYAMIIAVQKRPELAQQLLLIEDAEVRRQLAANQRLPRLDANFEVRAFGIGDEIEGSYENIADGEFIDYLVGVSYEKPLGNRAADADYRRARLLQQAQTLRYRRSVEDVVLSVKQSMRSMHTAYRVLQIARVGRRAAAENLRAIDERERLAETSSPEFLLDLKLRTQERLANAQITEARALIDFNIAVSQYYASTGTLLDRHGITIGVPVNVQYP